MTARSTASAVLAALVPLAALALDPDGWRPFGAAKWGAVGVLAVVGLTAAAVAARPMLVDRRSAVAWLVLLALVAVAAIAGADPLYAWIGAPGRHLGVLTWALFALLFVAAQAAWPDGDARPLVTGATVAGLGIGCYAIAELLDAEPVTLAETSGRLTGPSGSAAYLGAATVLLTFVLGGAALAPRYPPLLRGAGALAGAATLVALLGSQTRGALAGLVVGGAAAAYGARGWLRAHRAVAAGGAGVLAVATVLVLALSPVGQRLGSAADEGARDRLDEWRVALAAVADRPFLGSGPEGYRIVFGEAVDAAYERRHGRDVVPDRTHNGVLELGVIAGVPGMIAWLALLATLAPAVVRALRTGAAVPVGLAAAMVAYVAQQQFLFPLAEVDPAFWLIAGLVVATHGRTAEKAAVTVPRAVPVGLAVVSGIAVVAATAGVLADRSAAAAVRSLASGDRERAAEHVDRATGLRPDDLRYHLLAALIDEGMAPTVADIDAALDHVDRALALSPHDPVALGARADLLTTRSTLTGDTADVAAALDAWSELVADDPNNAGRRVGLAAISDRAGDTEGAARHWSTAAELAPDDPFPLQELARLRIGQGELHGARELLERAVERDPHDGSTLELLRTVLAGLRGD